MVWWSGIDRVKDTIRKINEDLEVAFDNPANNKDEDKCQCWIMHDGVALVKAMLCGSTFCKNYLNKDIWNVGSSGEDGDN